MTTKTLTACANSSGFRAFTKNKGSGIILFERRCSDSEFNPSRRDGGEAPQLDMDWSSTTTLDIKNYSLQSNLASFSDNLACLLFYQDEGNCITVYAQAMESQSWKASQFDNIKDCLPGTNMGVSMQRSDTAAKSKGVLCYQNLEGYIRYCTITGTYDDNYKTWSYSADVASTLQDSEAAKGTGIAVVHHDKDCIHVFFQTAKFVVAACTITDHINIGTCLCPESESKGTVIQSISALSPTEGERSVVRVFLKGGHGIETYTYHWQGFTKSEESTSPGSVLRLHSKVNKMGDTRMQVVSKGEGVALVFYLDTSKDSETPLSAIIREGYQWNNINLKYSISPQDGNGTTDDTRSHNLIPEIEHPVPNGIAALIKTPKDTTTPAALAPALGAHTSAGDGAPKTVDAVKIYHTSEGVNNVVIHYSDQTKASLFDRADETGNPEVLKMKPGEELSTIWIQSNADKTMLIGVRFATSFARTTKWCGALLKTPVQPRFIDKDTFEGWSGSLQKSFSWGTSTTCMNVSRIIASLEAAHARYEGSVNTICDLERASVDMQKAYNLTLIERFASRVEYLKDLEDALQRAAVAGRDFESRTEGLEAKARSCRETLEDIRQNLRRCFEICSKSDSVWAQHTMLDLNALADHISLWKQAVKTLMDKEIEEWTGRAEAANVWVTKASGDHPVSSGLSHSCMCNIKEFDSEAAKEANERLGRSRTLLDRARTLRDDFFTQLTELGQGVQPIKDSLTNREAGKQDMGQTVLALQGPDENLKQASGFKEAFRRMLKAAEEIDGMKELLPSHEDSSVQYLLGSSTNDSTAN